MAEEAAPVPLRARFTWPRAVLRSSLPRAAVGARPGERRAAVLARRQAGRQAGRQGHPLRSLPLLPLGQPAFGELNTA
ncbi:hypothetical protein GN956_G18410 [Arapaima gigas]